MKKGIAKITAHTKRKRKSKKKERKKNEKERKERKSLIESSKNKHRKRRGPSVQPCLIHQGKTFALFSLHPIINCVHADFHSLFLLYRKLFSCLYTLLVYSEGYDARLCSMH